MFENNVASALTGYHEAILGKYVDELFYGKRLHERTLTGGECDGDLINDGAPGFPGNNLLCRLKFFEP